MVQNQAKKNSPVICSKKYLDRIFRQDFFKTASTHRDTSILHVFGDVGSPEVPLTPSRTCMTTQIPGHIWKIAEIVNEIQRKPLYNMLAYQSFCCIWLL